MPRGGKRKNQTGRPTAYKDPISINFRCERSLREKLDSYLKDHPEYKDRSALISSILNARFGEFNSP